MKSGMSGVRLPAGRDPFVNPATLLDAASNPPQLEVRGRFCLLISISLVRSAKVVMFSYGRGPPQTCQGLHSKSGQSVTAATSRPNQDRELRSGLRKLDQGRDSKGAA